MNLLDEVFDESPSTDKKKGSLLDDVYSEPEAEPKLEQPKPAAFDESKIQATPVNQPSQFSSGYGPQVPLSDNPDWAFTAATGGPAGMAQKALGAGMEVVGDLASRAVNNFTAPMRAIGIPVPKMESGKPIIPDEALPLAKEKGVIPALTRILQGFTTPENVALLPLAAENKVIQAAFLAQSGLSLPEAANRVLDAKTPEEQRDAATELVANLGMAALMAKGLKGKKLEIQGPMPTGEVLNLPEGAKPPVADLINQPKEGESYAREITSPESVLEPEVRPSVGESAPLRQPGETPAAQQPRSEGAPSNEGGAQGGNKPTLTPALLIEGKPVVGGLDHQAIFDSIRKNPEASTDEKVGAAEAMLDDSKHVFVDSAGNVLSREQAIPVLEQITGKKVTEPVQSSMIPDSAKVIAPKPTPAAVENQVAIPRVQSEPSQPQQIPVNPTVEPPKPVEAAKPEVRQGVEESDIARRVAETMSKDLQTRIKSERLFLNADTSRQNAMLAEHSVERKLPEAKKFASALESKDPTYFIERNNGMWQSVWKAFESETGIKPGKTQKAIAETIRNFVGPEKYDRVLAERNKIRADKLAADEAASNQRRRDYELKKPYRYAIGGAGEVKTITAKAMIEDLIARGYTRAESAKRGAVNVLRLWKGDNQYMELRPKAEQEYARELIGNLKNPDVAKSAIVEPATTPAIQEPVSEVAKAEVDVPQAKKFPKKSSTITLKVKHSSGEPPYGGGVIEVTGKIVNIPSAPKEFEYVAYKTQRGFWKVVEKTTGLTLGNVHEKTLSGAIERADFISSAVNPEAFRSAVENAEKLNPNPTEPANINTGALGEVGMGAAKPKTSEMVGMGAAVPAEFGQPNSIVSNMFAAIDKSRAEMGLEPMEATKRRTWDEDNQKALAKMNREPDWIPNLLREVAANPRPLLSWENAGVVWYRHKLKAEADSALQRVAQSFDDGRLDDLAEAKADVAMFESQLDALDSVVGRNGAGSEAGRSLRAQRMASGDDFSLVEMRLQKRNSANDGAPLTDVQEREVRAMYEKIKATEEAYRKRGEQLAKTEFDLAMAKLELEAKKDVQPVEPHVRLIADRLKGFFDTQAKSALGRIKQRRSEGRLFTGIDPSEIGDYAVYGASKILSKGISAAEMAADWASEMKAEIGDYIAPHLLQIWKASQKALEDQIAAATKSQTEAKKVRKAVKTLTPEEKRGRSVSAIEKKIGNGQRSEISSSVRMLARSFVEAGMKDRDELIDAVHKVLNDIDPSFTRREAMDAISGYGEFKQLSKDEISVRLRGLVGEMQQVAKLEDMAAGIPPSKTGIERRIPTQKERELIKAVNEAKIKFQIPITDPATQLKSALDTKKSQLENQIADYKRRLAEGDFEKKPKRMLQMDARANELHYEMTKAKTAWHEAMMKDRLAKRSTFKKILGGGAEVLNTSRAIMTSADFSAVLRQGGFIAFAHPIRAVKSFPAMFRAFRSESGQHAVNQEIMRRPNYPIYNSSKLFLSEHGHKLSQMEEAYMSRWADKIPLVAGSQRAYVTFLNKLRADSFDAMAKALSKDKELSKVEADAIANFVNIATGRGNFGAKDNALVGLNTAFFAPRLVASRFQLLAGQPLYRGNLATRKLVATEYARFLAGIGMVYALGSMAGATIESDPRSSDFGKMRFGDTRLDPLAGLSQSTVLLSRLLSGETKSISGKITPIRGEKVPYGSSNSADVIGRFLRSKLSPIIGSGINALTGKDVVGNKVTVASETSNLLLPLSFQDIFRTMKEQGVPAGTAFALLSMFGMSLQNYQPKKQAPTWP